MSNKADLGKEPVSFLLGDGLDFTPGHARGEHHLIEHRVFQDDEVREMMKLLEHHPHALAHLMHSAMQGRVGGRRPACAQQSPIGELRRGNRRIVIIPQSQPNSGQSGQ